MTKNKHTTTTPTNPLAAPAKEKLPAAAFFRVILGDDPLPAAEDVLPFQPGPDPLRLFADYDTRPLWLVHMGSTLFCHAWHGLVQTAEQRSRNGHQVAGGKAHPLGLQPDDLAQEPFPEGPLTLTPWGLCLRLLADLPVLVRLIRAARRWQARKRLTWKGYFEAAGVVALRLLRVEQALWEQTDPWFSEVCLRWALRETWKALFGPSVRVPAELKYWFKPLAMTVEQERALLRRLAPEGKLAQAVVPPPFAGVVARWQSGDLPEEVLSDAPLPPAQARCVRAYV